MVDQNVFSLDVTVGDARIVEMFDRQDKLAEYNACQFLSEHLRIFDQAMELTVASELHDVVEDASCTTVGRTIDSAHLKICDLNDTSVTGFRTHLYLIKERLEQF